MKCVPELYCENIKITTAFYVNILGFQIKYQRPKEEFVYFTLDGVDIMVEGIKGQGRRWLTASLEKPMGRGVNFQWDVKDIESMYKRINAQAPESVFLALESKQYACNDKMITQKQFIVQDPNGYLFRFCSDADTNKKTGYNNEQS